MGSRNQTCGVFWGPLSPDGDPGGAKGMQGPGSRAPFAENQLTDAEPHDQAAGEQRLLVVGRGQHRGPGREEGTGQQDGGAAAEDAVEGPAGQRRDGGRPHGAGHEQLLPQRVQAELPLEQQHGPRHHAGVIAEQEAAQRGEDGHHVHEGGGLVLLELPPRRALQVPDAAAARARALQAGARLGGRQEAALPGRARRVRLLLLPAPLAHEAAQAPQRVLHILARLAGHRAGARDFPGGRGSAGRRSPRAGQPKRAGPTPPPSSSRLPLRLPPQQPPPRLLRGESCCPRSSGAAELEPGGSHSRLTPRACRAGAAERAGGGAAGHVHPGPAGQGRADAPPPPWVEPGSGSPRPLNPTLPVWGDL